MGFDPLTSGFDLGTAIVGLVSKFVPDKTIQEQETFATKIQELADAAAIEKAQSSIDEAEAASSSLFVAGARPAILWICAGSFAWQFLILPMIMFLQSSFGVHIVPPIFDTATMNQVLMGMLGLGAMRTYEKVQDTKTKNSKTG